MSEMWPKWKMETSRHRWEEGGGRRWAGREIDGVEGVGEQRAMNKRRR